jgi:bifunctional non-homologous end joining protein LigD
MSLKRYKEKRDFTRTREPKGAKRAERASRKKLIFVIQKHDATRLHYDFRLEVGGVLKSWAVPKGPSLDPQVKRLAIEVEDHPYDYKDFEGEIPKGNYGAGDVIVWDQGVYASAHKGDGEKELLRDLKKGHLAIILLGKKIQGAFTLVRTGRTDKRGDKRQWLLMKMEDDFASKRDITKETRSVLSKRTLPRDT